MDHDELVLSLTTHFVPFEHAVLGKELAVLHDALRAAALVVIRVVGDQQIGCLLGFDQVRQRVEHAVKRQLIEIIVRVDDLEISAMRKF